MKKWTVILGLAMLLCVALAAQTMAAPTVTVSAKYQYLGPVFHSPQLELGFPLTDSFSFILQGGPTLPAPMGIVLGGLRYYLAPEGLRPFGTLYGGVMFMGGVLPVGAATVGLEYLDASGFRIAGEVGAWDLMGSLFFTGGAAIGWAF